MTLWLGLMSGTSMDSVDAVLVSFGEPGVNIHSTLSLPYPGQLRRRLLQAVRNQADTDEIGGLVILTRQHFAKAAIDLIHQSGVNPQEIRAIGSHGQTIRRQPSGAAPFTMQIGNAAWIAEATVVTTAAHVRTQDMAAHGQCAPLFPAFHCWLFGSAQQD